MGKNRFIYIEEVNETQWAKESYERYQERKNLTIDFDCFMDAVNKCLTAEEKNVLLTHLLDGEPYEHIGMRLGCCKTNVWKICRRAKNKLRNYYKKHKEVKDGITG